MQQRLFVTGFLAVVFGFAGLSSATAAANRITVNFSQPADPPLVKKFAMMNAGIVPASNYERDLATIQPLKPDSLRIDLSIGKTWNTTWSKQIIDGTASNLTYYWPEIDKLSSDLNRYGVLPYWSLCYTPLPVQIDGSWRSGPSDLNAWRAMHREFSRHFREAGIKIGYFEHYNEPDFKEFYIGSFDNYLQMYKYGTLGYKEGDPDAVIGGPALAFTKSWVNPLIDFVNSENLPMDFFSFHNIFPMEEKRPWHSPLDCIRDIRASLSRYPRFATTELHLNEHHPYDFEGTRRGNGVDKYPLAARIFDDVEEMVQYPDLTLIHWAQFMDCAWGDESMGVVSQDGEIKPSYGAFAIYADMPIDRVTATGTEPLHIMASADDETAGAVIWNRSAQAQKASVTFTALPFASSKLQVYKIDAKHNATGERSRDGQLQPADTKKIGADHCTWTGKLPPHAVVYLKFANAARPAARRLPSAKIVRLHHYFPNRDSSAYASFDRTTWTARVGMVKDGQGTSVVGATLSDCPAALELGVKIDGEPKPLDAQSALGVRVDFETPQGITKSVFYHAGLYNASTEAGFPWGTGHAAEQAVQVKPGATWPLDLAGVAPEGWNHRVIISFVMHYAGAGAKARFMVNAAP